MRKVSKFRSILVTTLLVSGTSLFTYVDPLRFSNARSETINCATTLEFEKVETSFSCTKKKNTSNKISLVNKDTKNTKKVTLKVIESDEVKLPTNKTSAEFTVEPTKQKEIQLENKPTKVEIKINTQ